MDIVEESGGQYHVLLIIADGQVIFAHLFAESIYVCFGEIIEFAVCVR